MTQQELAVAADLSVSMVSQVEQGVRPDPRLSTVLAIAKGLRVKPCELLAGLVEGR